jgi:hypothetical protein
MPLQSKIYAIALAAIVLGLPGASAAEDLQYCVNNTESPGNWVTCYSTLQEAEGDIRLGRWSELVPTGRHTTANPHKRCSLACPRRPSDGPVGSC